MLTVTCALAVDPLYCAERVTRPPTLPEAATMPVPSTPAIDERSTTHALGCTSDPLYVALKSTGIATPSTTSIVAIGGTIASCPELPPPTLQLKPQLPPPAPPLPSPFDAPLPPAPFVPS